MAETLRTSLPDGFQPWQANTAEEQDKQPRPAKRARVALACQRCKSRKQKCDGGHPSCSKCRHLQAQCEYVIPAKPMPFGKNQYIKALERRVNELEGCLAKGGLPVPGRDHWQYLPRPEAAVAEDSKSVDSGPSTEQETSLSRRRGTAAGDGAEGGEPDSDDEAVFEWQQGFDSMVGVLRDLSLDVNGGYIGASSHIGMGRLLGSIVKRKKKPLSVPLDSGTDDSNDNSMSNIMIQDISDEAEGFENIPPEIADRLIVGYMKHISTRFPLLSTPWIRRLHARRYSITDTYERCTLRLVYASGGRFLETTGETGRGYIPEHHHEEALKDLDMILQYHDWRSVTILALLAVFSLRAPVGPGAWAYNRLAMLIAIDLGLHRRPQSKKITFELEMRKRIFWSCYAFDRQISIPLGRPFAISDQDIDCPLPFDVDEENEDVSVLEKAASLDQNARRTTSSSMSSFLHIVRLRKIESKIQQTVYRVDSTTGVSDAIIDGFLDELSTWKSLIPLDTRKKTDLEARAFDGYDYYMVFYFKCLRLLLYPQLSKEHVNPQYLKACAAACGGVCLTYKRLHQTMSVGYSMMALQTVFMAGLTLVYCCWIQPQLIYEFPNNENIASCSIMLFVITERVKTAEKYRNAFEIVKHRVVDQLARKGGEPRQTIGGLTTDLQSTFKHLKDSDDGYQHEQFTQIVTRMAGEDTKKGAGMPPAPSRVDSQATLPDMITQQHPQPPPPQPQPQAQQQPPPQPQHPQQHPHYAPHTIPPHMQQPQPQVHPGYRQYSGFENENMPALGMPPVEYLPNGMDMSNSLPMENYLPMNNDGFDPRMI
ncbi:hypothetical protein FQN54_002843 [Arachnomyces sp. PD_36]|nr:hypothetical protein FQN54_002843 [Arachnomyces sp. PD_36]